MSGPLSRPPAGTGTPRREDPKAQWATRAAALAGLAATAGYLAWRLTATMAWSAWWVAVPLFLLELHAGISLALFTHDTWDVTTLPDAGPRLPAGRVAVLIPTYTEPAEVLLPTIAAAVA